MVVIDISQMVNAVYPIEKVEEAFDVLKSGEDPKPIISILDYGVDLDIDLTKTISKRVDLVKSSSNSKIVNVALIGTGGFATGMHLPNMAKLSNKFKIKAIVNRTGQKAKAVAEQYSADYATTDIQDVLNDKAIDLVMITTRHESHGAFDFAMFTSWQTCVC